MLSQSVEYALRACVHLAQFAPQSRTTDEIAEHTKVPRAYLSKIINSLVRAKLIETRRGLHGGVLLTKSPSEINMLQIINAVEPLERIRSCPLGIPMHGTQLCSLHRRLDTAIAAIEKAFGDTSLSELIFEQNPSRPLCILPIRRRA
ncbi:MAG: Rrf2 family transcriptional regulator [Gemmatales bacterium]